MEALKKAMNFSCNIWNNLSYTKCTENNEAEIIPNETLNKLKKYGLNSSKRNNQEPYYECIQDIFGNDLKVIRLREKNISWKESNKIHDKKMTIHKNKDINHINTNLQKINIDLTKMVKENELLQAESTISTTISSSSISLKNINENEKNRERQGEKLDESLSPFPLLHSASEQVLEALPVYFMLESNDSIPQENQNTLLKKINSKEEEMNTFVQKSDSEIKGSQWNANKQKKRSFSDAHKMWKFFSNDQIDNFLEDCKHLASIVQGLDEIEEFDDELLQEEKNHKKIKLSQYSAEEKEKALRWERFNRCHRLHHQKCDETNKNKY